MKRKPISAASEHDASLAESTEDSDLPSGLSDGQLMTVRCLTVRSPDAATLRSGIAKTGMRIEEVRLRDDALREPVPLMAVIDMSSPGAGEALGMLVLRSPRCWTAAIASGPAQELDALCAGAEVVLRGPLNADVVALQLERLRERMFQMEMARNTTERETAIARADSVGHFARSVTHEIFEPLSVAAVNVRLLTEMLDKDLFEAQRDEFTEVTHDLADAVDRMHRVVVEMRSFVRADARPLEVVRLSDVVQEALAAVPNPRGVPVEVAVVTDERAVARRELLEKVVDILLSNAIGAAAEAADPRVVVRVYRHAGEPRISVRDNGPPITPEIKHRIFQPFFHPRGAPRQGVGLAVCREFVARMDGALTLAAGDQGANFRIRLRSA